MSRKRTHSRSHSSVKRGGLPATSPSSASSASASRRARIAAVSQDGQLALRPTLAQEQLGHLVKEIAALERLEALAFLRWQCRLEAQHVLEQVLEAAAGVGGEAARRDRGARRGGIEAAANGGGRLGGAPSFGAQATRPS